MEKKLLSIILIVCLFSSIFSNTSFAAEIQQNPVICLSDLTGIFKLKTETAEGQSVKYYSIDGGTQWIEYAGQITLKDGETLADNQTVAVISGSHQVILSGATLSGNSASKCPFYISNGAEVQLTLVGSNIIKNSGDQFAGIEVLANSRLTINGTQDDSLEVTGGRDAAGIGGSYKVSNGTIIINGGCIKATGGDWGAGIGGGFMAEGGTVLINGGFIEANGGKDASGIGSGGGSDVGGNGPSITIRGGTIYANSGKSAANIGCGYGSVASTVVITGGSIQTGSQKTSSQIIGNSMATNGTSSITDGKGNTVELAEVTLKNAPVSEKVNALTVLKDVSYGIEDMQTREGKLYLYLPVESGVTSVTTQKLYGGLVRAGSSGELTDTYEFVYYEPENLFYTGEEKTASVKWNLAGDLGDITVKYKEKGEEEYLLYAPVELGTYEVYASAVAAKDNDTVSEQKVGEFTIIRDDCPDENRPANVVMYHNGFTDAAFIFEGKDDVEYEYSMDKGVSWNAIQTTNKKGSISIGNTGFYRIGQVQLRAKETEYYNAGPIVQNESPYLKVGAVKPKQGDGSEEAPYQISDEQELLWFAQLVNGTLETQEKNAAANAALMNDIDLSMVSNAQQLIDWCTIGTDRSPYIGSFDGNGYAIHHMSISGDNAYQGFFGVLSGGAAVHDIVIESDCSINAGHYSAALAGATMGSGKVSFSKCGNKAAVDADYNAAGIFGCNINSSCTIQMTDCYNIGNIVATKEGGSLSGWLGGNPVVTNCYSTAAVTSGDGFMRCSGTPVISGCYMIDSQTTTVTGVEKKSEETFASGEIAWLLNTAGKSYEAEDYVHTGLWTMNHNTPVFANDQNSTLYRLALYSSDRKTITANYYREGETITYPSQFYTTETLIEKMPAKDKNYYYGLNIKYMAPKNLVYTGNPVTASVESGESEEIGSITVKYRIKNETVFLEQPPCNPGTYDVYADIAESANNEKVDNQYLGTFTIQKAQCPSANVPVNGKVEANRTKDAAFTFSGLDGVKYEYSLDQGKSWSELETVSGKGIVLIGNEEDYLVGEVQIRAKETVYYLASAVIQNEETFCITSGTGEKDDPYVIGNEQTLRWFSNKVNSENNLACAKLTDDISISGNWCPIGATREYKGNFDGDGHTIIFDINDTETYSNYGLFGISNYNYVSNLTLKGTMTSTIGWSKAGALAGSSYASHVSNVTSMVKVINTKADSITGGLIGYFGGGKDAVMQNCCVMADITGTKDTGGLIGQGWAGKQYYAILNSFYIGTVSHTANSGSIGALVGYSNTGNAGYSNQIRLTDCYYNSSINAVGGWARNDAQVTNVEQKSAEQFASGEVAWLMNQGQDITWYQNIDIGTPQAYPVLSNQSYTVQQLKEDDKNVYSNYLKNRIMIVSEKNIHIYDKKAYKPSITKGEVFTWEGDVSAQAEGYYVKDNNSYVKTSQNDESGADAEGAAPVNAGTYYLKLTIPEYGQYKETTDYLPIVIEKAEAEIILDAGKEQVEKTYDNKEFTLDGVSVDEGIQLHYEVMESQPLVAGSGVVSVSNHTLLTVCGVGTAKIVISTVETQNYRSAAAKTVMVTIHKGKNYPNMIADSMQTQYKEGKKVSDIELPEGWIWNEKDAGIVLQPNANYEARAEYVGALSQFYENNTVTVKIKVDSNEQEQKPELKPSTVVKGKTYTVNSMKYKVTKVLSNGTGTVILIGTTKKKTDKKFTSLSVGKTVKIGKKSFQITAIGSNAFKEYTNLKKITLGTYVSSIGSNAFYNCKKLSKLTINSTIIRETHIKNMYWKPHILTG